MPVGSVSILALLCLTIVEGIQLQLEDQNVIVFNSSCPRGTMSISMSSYGKLNSSFYVQSQIFSPLRNRYQIIHGSNKVVTDPQLKQQQINFNDFDGSEYWLAIKHQIRHTDPKLVQFVGLRLIDHDNTHDFILPAFPQPLSFLPLSSLYRCNLVLVSISPYKDGLDIVLFSKLANNVSWVDDKHQWSWGFRKTTDEFEYGRHTRKVGAKQIKITLTNNEYCAFNTQYSPQSSNHKLAKQGYLSFQTVLQAATPLAVQQGSQRGEQL